MNRMDYNDKTTQTTRLGSGFLDASMITFLREKGLGLIWRILWEKWEDYQTVRDSKDYWQSYYLS